MMKRLSILLLVLSALLLLGGCALEPTYRYTGTTGGGGYYSGQSVYGNAGTVVYGGAYADPWAPDPWWGYYGPGWGWGGIGFGATYTFRHHRHWRRHPHWRHHHSHSAHHRHPHWRHTSHPRSSSRSRVHHHHR